MATVKLTIRSANGSVTLTNYLDVEEGKGLEPGAPTFTNKVFAHSLLKQGATLALEDLQLKEQVFPVKLTASTKEGLTRLVEKVNLVINTPGAQVEWQDEGANRPTYFDLVSGQFDDEFDFRLGQNNWLKGRLRLFSQPLGYWSQNGARQVMVSGIATTTAIGTNNPVIIFPASGTFEGDAPALIQVAVEDSATESASKSHKNYYALSVLPSSEFLPFVTPASALSLSPPGPSPAFISASGIPGGTAAHWVVNSVNDSFMHFKIGASARFSYAGETRLLLAARTPSGFNPVTFASYQPGQGYTLLSGAAISASPYWNLYDMGVARGASVNFSHNGNYEWTINFDGAASAAIDVAGIIQLPESSTVFVNAASSIIPNYPAEVNSLHNAFSFDGVGNSIQFGSNIGIPASGIAPSGPGFGPVNFSSLARGAIPQVFPAASAPIFAVLRMAAVSSDQSEPVTNRVSVNVLERFRYAA